MIIKDLFGGYILSFYNADSNTKDTVHINNLDILPSFIRTYFSILSRNIDYMIMQYIKALQKKYVPNQEKIDTWQEHLKKAKKLHSKTIKTLDIIAYRNEISIILNELPKSKKSKIDLYMFALYDIEETKKMVKILKNATT